MRTRWVSQVARVGEAQQAVLIALGDFLRNRSKDKRRVLETALCRHDDLLDGIVCDWSGLGPTLYERQAEQDEGQS